VYTVAKREYVARHGPEALLPERKEPYNDRVLAAVRNVAPGTAIAGRRLDWAADFFVAFWAALNLTRAAGMRKAEVTVATAADFSAATLSYASLVWRIKGVLIAAPTTEDIRRLTVGDAVAVKPGPSKADQHGEKFGSNPIWIPFGVDAYNAAKGLADLELLFRPRPQDRARTPLFSTSRAGREPLTAKQFDATHSALFVAALGREEAQHYSGHSGRIELACRLLAAGASPGLIQKLVRWRSAEALDAYARINPDEYTGWLQRAADADPSSVQARHLPTIDWDRTFIAADSAIAALSTLP
jgi:hypothetical protein